MTNLVCARCGAKSQLALCHNHVTELRDMLTQLAIGKPARDGKGSTGWLEDLADAAHGQSKMGDGGGRRGPSEEAPLRFNERASDLSRNAHGTLARIVQEMCESRGIDYQRVTFVRPNFIGPLQVGVLRGLHYMGGGADLALWLLIHVDAMIVSPDVGQFYDDIAGLIDGITRVIDKPIRRVWLGDCPTWHEESQNICGVSLWAPEDAIEVYCRVCRATHSCNRLRLLLQGDLERTRVPWEKILRANKSQPADRQIPERTLQSWRNGQNGKPARLQIRGYRRPNGRIANTQHSVEDVPLYLWPDVRKLRDEKPQKKATGAAARRSCAS